MNGNYLTELNKLYEASKKLTILKPTPKKEKTKMKRMTKFITVGEKTYKVRRVKPDLYALHLCNGFSQYEFFGYQDKFGIEDAIYRGTW